MALTSRRPAIAALIAAVIAASALAACGDDDDESAIPGPSAGSGPVSVQSIDGSDVLVDRTGQVLYSAKQEAGGEIVCRDGCLSIWEPLSLSAASLDETGELSPSLDTIERPDGGEQVTFEGMPLYTFTEEGPGELTGQGLVDEFEGVTFEWEAASTGPSEDAEPGGSAAPSSSSSGY